MAASRRMWRSPRECWRAPGWMSARSNAARTGRSHQPSAQALARSGAAPSALHNNCSGKHAGFLCVACAAGVDHRGYVGASHVVQREVKAAIEALAGHRHSGGSGRQSTAARCRPGRCRSTALARAFARFGSGRGMAPERAKARQAHPPRMCAQTLLRRRHRPVLHRDHAALRRARVGEDRRRGRVLRRAARAGARHRAQMRRWRRPRRRGDDGGGAATFPAARDEPRERWRASCARHCATGTCLGLFGPRPPPAPRAPPPLPPPVPCCVGRKAAAARFFRCLPGRRGAGAPIRLPISRSGIGNTQASSNSPRPRMASSSSRGAISTPLLLKQSSARPTMKT